MADSEPEAAELVAVRKPEVRRRRKQSAIRLDNRSERDRRLVRGEPPAALVKGPRGDARRDLGGAGRVQARGLWWILGEAAVECSPEERVRCSAQTPGISGLYSGPR